MYYATYSTIMYNVPKMQDDNIHVRRDVFFGKEFVSRVIVKGNYMHELKVSNLLAEPESILHDEGIPKLAEEI